jgi:hypothetical protein
MTFDFYRQAEPLQQIGVSQNCILSIYTSHYVHVMTCAVSMNSFFAVLINFFCAPLCTCDNDFCGFENEPQRHIK